MQKSARISARSSVEVKYWTADAQGQRMIAKWLESEHEDNEYCFYASFLNWCSKHVTKLKNPTAKYPSEEDKTKAQKLRNVLREQPLDVREFIELMEIYARGPWGAGIHTGAIGMPQKARSRDIMYGDKRLREVVWTQGERLAMMIANKEEAPSDRMQKKLDRARLEMKMAEEERKLNEKQWKALNNAVGEVEEEIEVEDNTAAMDEFAISQKLPWEEDLVDRTRD